MYEISPQTMSRMGPWTRKNFDLNLKLLCILVFSIAALVLSALSFAEVLQAIEPLISHGTRLMIFSPHPDDESLGAGGLIQRVLNAGGKVRVVFMTNGDGFPEGVEKEDRISNPTAKDYTKYGEERREEALKAAAVLGVKERDVIFLGFPDGGLNYLRLKFQAHPMPFRSPFTRRIRPPAFEVIVPRTDYCGKDVVREIERVLAEFRPNLVATTPPEDQHPDHSSTYYFVKDALRHCNNKHPNLKPRMITFLIHYGQWPLDQGAGTGLRLNPPDNFPAKGDPWISFALKPEEVETKRKAILQYRTQMLVMGRFLMSFSRSNELFMPDE
jgi:LmbE family N-acetylglucosaminyl deacetylase